MDKDELHSEFDRQVDRLVLLGYPAIVPVGSRTFLKGLRTLKTRIDRLPSAVLDVEKGRLPFVLVVPGSWICVQDAMALAGRDCGRAYVDMFPREPGDFRLIRDLVVPDLPYLIADIDRGGRYNNVTPRDAQKSITRRKRSPLTIDEGIAILTQFPRFLRKGNCFSLLGSRIEGDLRVPALWIDKDKRTRLGWCWEGNPHSWLGSASCKRRISTR